jgi:hypothetical protein
MLARIVFACVAFGITVTSTPQAPAAANQPIPATGENGKPSGIFGFDLNMQAMLKGSPNAKNGGTGTTLLITTVPSLFRITNFVGK